MPKTVKKTKPSVKIKKFQNGGRNGDPIPSDSTGVAASQVQPVLTDSAGVGYIRNEGGNLVPIGFSEFHEEPEIDMDGLMRGIAAVESGGGQDRFMKNPVTSATGTYQQLFDEIIDMDIMKGITRDDFAKDRELQDKLFEMRYYGEIPDVPGLEDNAYELTEMFKDDLGDKWDFSLDEVAALSHFIGRQGAINYFKALKAGKADETYKPPGINKTVVQYLKEYREARDSSMEKNEGEVRDTLKSAINPAFIKFFPDMANE